MKTVLIGALVHQIAALNDTRDPTRAWFRTLCGRYNSCAADLLGEELPTCVRCVVDTLPDWLLVAKELGATEISGYANEDPVPLKVL